MTDAKPHRPTPADPVTCPVCPHRKAEHDAIARRFCSATVAGSTARGCACRPAG